MNKPTLKDMLLFFLKLGATGFGGPVVLCEHMHKALVEERRWISQEEYNQGFALSQLAPGPLAAQLAIYLGWVRGGILWATLVPIAFILPSLILVFFMAFFYMKYEGLGWIQGAFYGVGSAVVALIAMSAYRLVTKTFKADRMLWAIGIVSAVVTFWTEDENLFLFLGAGLLVMFARVRMPATKLLSLFVLPPIFLMGLQGEGSASLINTLFWFFAKSGALVFGSGLAIVPFLHSGVVLEHHWLTERQFLDAVAVAMITPGPLLVTVGFIGYLVSGLLGGLVAAIGVFLPCYLFVVIPAPYYSQIAKNLKIKAFVDGVTAAAIGAIAGAAVILAEKALIDWITAVIALLTLVAVLKVKRIPEPILILIAGVAGVILK